MSRGCSVLGCENKRKRKYEDISFHQFPKDAETCKKWAAATGRKNWEPNRLSRICSIHFEEDCFKRCKSQTFIKQFAFPTLFLYEPASNTDKHTIEIPYPGHKYVVLTTRPTEIPESLQDGIEPVSNTDKPSNLEIPYPGHKYVVLTTRPTETPESLQDGIIIKDIGSTSLEVCRVCLAVGCKMFRLSGRLNLAYTQLTGIPVSSHDGLPQLLCWECASRVLSAVELRDRAMKAHNILTSLLTLQGSINMQDIRSVNREQMKLMSSLNYDVFKDKPQYNIFKVVEVEKSYNSDDNTGLDDNTQAFRNEFEDNDDVYDDEVDEDDDDKSDRDEDDYSYIYNSDVDGDDYGDMYISDGDQNDNNEEFDKYNQRSHKPKIVSKLEEFFTVTPVNLEDAIAEVQSRKLSKAYLDAPYKCEVCYRGYRQEKHYEMHTMKHTESFGRIECEVCKIRYETKGRLTGHMTRMHLRKYRCKQCEFVTDSSTRADNHRQVHAGTLLKCPHCPKVLQQKSSYYGHIRYKHACSFTCELCGHTFLSAFGVKQHKSRQHKHDDLRIEGPFCDTCDVTFATREAYDTHLLMSSRHNNDSLLSQVNLYQTIRRKDGTKQRAYIERRPRRKPTLRAVTCEKCGVTLDSTYSYSHHFKSMHPGETRTQLKWRPIVCEQCGRTFTCLATLKAHMPVHTGERFICDHCGRAFKGKFNLYQHLKIHEPSRPKYTCELCGKLFHFSHNLKRHVLLHANATPFECDACGKGLTTRASLKAHIDHVHIGRPWPKRVRLRHRP